MLLCFGEGKKLIWDRCGVEADAMFCDDVCVSFRREGTFISRHSPSLHFCCRDFNPGTFLSPFYFYFFPIFIHTFSILSMQRDQILT